MKRKVFIVLGLLIVLVPLGLLTDSSAWGEWESNYYKKILGFVPDGIKSAKGVHPILPDYSVPGLNETIGYYISAIVGLLLIFVVFYLLVKIFKRERNGSY